MEYFLFLNDVHETHSVHMFLKVEKVKASAHLLILSFIVMLPFQTCV